MGSCPFLVVGADFTVVPFLLFGPFSVPPVVTAFTVRKVLGWRGDGLHCSESVGMEKCSVFLFLLPRSRLAGPCFRSVGCFSSWLEWELLLVEASGKSLSPGRAFFGRLVLPDSSALGAGLPGPPGSWSLELLPSSRSGCVLLFVTPFAILVFPGENFGFMGVDGVFGS